MSWSILLLPCAGDIVVTENWWWFLPCFYFWHNVSIFENRSAFVLFVTKGGREGDGGGWVTLKVQWRRRDFYLFLSGYGTKSIPWRVWSCVHCIQEVIFPSIFWNSEEKEAGRRSRREPVALLREVSHPEWTLLPWASFPEGHAESMVAGYLQDTFYILPQLLN